ncbi:MAG: lytic transglycosylase domain-containing protein [Clostridia bacterium]|nr:lytic transglycosylase domain-containing protein [Clostridia bacterium]
MAKPTNKEKTKDKIKEKSKNKPKVKNKKNLPFIVITSLLGVSIFIPLVLLIVSTLMNSNATKEFTKSLYPIKYESYVEKAAKEYNVDICLVYGVIRNESNFDPDIVSNAGAIGLMQIMPDTFTWLQNYRENFEPKKILDSNKLYDPKTNIDYGTYYLRYLLDKYDGDRSLVICAYNAGYGNVDSWIAEGTIPNGNVSPEDVPFPETSNYLAKVTESAEMYRELYFSKLESYPDGTASVEVSSQINMEEEEELNSSDFDEEMYWDENIDNEDDIYYNDDDVYYDEDYEYE